MLSSSANRLQIHRHILNFGKVSNHLSVRFISISKSYFDKSDDGVRVSSEHLLKKQKRNTDDLRLSLSRPLKDFPELQFATLNKESYEIKKTVLDNGLVVTTQPKYDSHSTVGVLIDAGSRFEVAYPSGTSLLLERLAFTRSSMVQNKDEFMQILESLGGICDCQSSRDVFVYAASVSREKVGGLVELFADTIFQPVLSDEDVDHAKQGIAFEIQDIDLRPDPEPLMTETIHAAAFRGNTLGLPRYPEINSLNDINRETLQTFLRSYFVPSNMVLAGVGVDHDELCQLADQYMTTSARLPSWGLDGKIVRDKSLAQYTGGEVKIEKKFDLSMSVVPMPDLTHVSVGLESVGFTDTDFIPFSVVNMLMGGGGSFSAGGPGKGMFSRLYLNVLNRYHWMYAATAFHHTYQDGGFFCIQASAPPNRTRDCISVILQEFVKLTHGVDPAELARAKKQLQSMLMMNLEARPVIFEDVGRQVLGTGRRISPNDLCQLIDEVTNEDIIRISHKMLKSKPCLSAVGSLKDLPNLSEIETALRGDGRLTSRFRFFNR